MKFTVTSLLLCLVLVGCGYQRYLKFDTQEYQNFIMVKVTADQAQPECHDNRFMVQSVYGPQLMQLAMVAQEYSMYRGTLETLKASEELKSLIQELNNRRQAGYSEAYCNDKLQNISRAAERIAATLAKKE